MPSCGIIKIRKDLKLDNLYLSIIYICKPLKMLIDVFMLEQSHVIEVASIQSIFIKINNCPQGSSYVDELMKT